jgi:hypothetical protein
MVGQDSKGLEELEIELENPEVDEEQDNDALEELVIEVERNILVLEVLKIKMEQDNQVLKKLGGAGHSGTGEA